MAAITLSVFVKAQTTSLLHTFWKKSFDFNVSWVQKCFWGSFYKDHQCQNFDFDFDLFYPCWLERISSEASSGLGAVSCPGHCRMCSTAKMQPTTQHFIGCDHRGCAFLLLNCKAKLCKLQRGAQRVQGALHQIMLGKLWGNSACSYFHIDVIHCKISGMLNLESALFFQNMTFSIWRKCVQSAKKPSHSRANLETLSKPVRPASTVEPKQIQ